MDLKMLVSVVFALGLPVWLAIEQLLHTFRHSLATAESVPTGRPEKPRALSRRVA